MKYLILVLCTLLFSSNAYSQKKKITEIPFNNIENRIFLNDVFEFENSINKVDIYSRIINWYDIKFKSLFRKYQNDGKVKIKQIFINAGVDSLSKNLSKISFNLWLEETPLKRNIEGYVNVNLTIWVKDNKIKYEFSDYSYNVTNSNTFHGVAVFEKPTSIVNKRNWDEFILININNSQRIIEELTDFIINSKTKDDMGF